MSHLIYELDQIVDRLLFVAPTQARLNRRFEEIASDLTQNFGAHQNLNLASVRLGSGPLKCWLAFDLGIRANLRARIQILGVSLDAERAPSQELLQANEAMIFDWDPGNPDDDRFLSLPLTQHNKEHPCLALVTNPNFEVALSDDLSRLRAKSQKRGLEESYDKFLVHTRSEDFLRQGLEWILSF